MALTTSDIVAYAVREGALQRPLELDPLVTLARERQPRTVLEIGTYTGGTLRCWCQCAAADALIVSIDLPGGPFGGGYGEGHIPHLLAHAIDQQTVRLIRDDSHALRSYDQVCGLLDEFDRNHLDFLFIDGDHTYSGVQSDYEMYAPLVRAGGLVALHDIAPYPELPECQVEAFWRERFHGRPGTREFVYPGDLLGCGIGVIEVPA